MKLWHLTDLHLPSDGGYAALAAADEQMATDDVLIVTGDLTENGTAEEYDLAYKALLPFRGNLVLCPGNHDYGLKGLGYSDEARERYYKLCRDLSASLPGTPRILGRWLVVSLDSCIWSESPHDLARGHLGDGELKRLDDALAMADRIHVRTIVCLHHDTPDDDWTMKLEDGDELLKRVWGKADVVLNGHTHGPAAMWTSPRGVATLMRRGQDAVGGGAASLWSMEMGARP